MVKFLINLVAEIFRGLNSCKQGRGVQHMVLRHGQQLNDAIWHNYKDLKDNLDVLNLFLCFHLDHPGASITTAGRGITSSQTCSASTPKAVLSGLASLILVHGMTQHAQRGFSQSYVNLRLIPS